MIKAVIPSMLQTIVDQAIQIHGGAGVSDDDFPLTALYGYARILRLADGPDEVHRGMVARLELRKYK
jgi:alkylation response protein AidB-like acyl-CoA dehydrogenase